MNLHIPLLITLAGICHFGILIASAIVPKVLQWQSQLKLLTPLCRHVIWTHGIFIVLVIIAFGTLSILLPTDLAAGTPIARALCAFIGIFWLLRLIIQLFFFNPKPYLTTPLLTLGYHALTIIFTLLSTTYLLAAAYPPYDFPR